MPKASQKSSGSQKPGKISDKPSQSRRSPSDHDDDDEDQDYVNTQTQRGSIATARRHLASMDEAEIEAKVNDLVRYLLIVDQKKYPIKRSDINKLVLKEMSKGFEYIMDCAKSQLDKVFGVDMVSVDSKVKSYILVNKLRMDCDKPHMVCNEREQSHRGFLILVLSLIFMNGNSISEKELWHALSEMKIAPDNVHRVFGNVKRLLSEEWARQGYLEYTRRPSSDPPEYDFQWGPRADAEVDKRELLEFVCEIHGDGVQAADWKGQYQDVLRSEGETDE